MSGLQLKKFKLMLLAKHKVVPISSDVSSSSSTTNLVIDQIEMGLATKRQDLDIGMDIDHGQIDKPLDGESLKFHAVGFLGYVVLGYLLVVHSLGVTRNVLKPKGLNLHTLSLFTTVSTFSSCAFVPTNEKHDGFLQKLRSPPHTYSSSPFWQHTAALMLEISIWVLGTLFTKKKQLCNYVLKNTGDWVPTFATKPPLITFGCHSFWVDCGTMGTTFILGVEFRQLKWTKSLPENHWRLVPKCEFKTCRGNYPDLSITSPAILVLFVVMM
nr:probable cation transporter HKT7 [Malus domestica]